MRGGARTESSTSRTLALMTPGFPGLSKVPLALPLQGLAGLALSLDAILPRHPSPKFLRGAPNPCGQV